MDFYQKYRGGSGFLPEVQRRTDGGRFHCNSHVELLVLIGITAGMVVHFVHTKGRLSRKAVDSVAFIRWRY